MDSLVEDELFFSAIFGFTRAVSDTELNHQIIAKPQSHTYILKVVNHRDL